MLFRKGKKDPDIQSRPNRGMSLVELVVVLTVLGILTAVSVPYLMRYTQKYKTEDQAIKVMDLMREAGQLALERRRTFRFELDLNNSQRPVGRIIDQDSTQATAFRTKEVPLEPVNEVRMDLPPLGIIRPNPPNYANAAFTSGVWTAFFRSDGTVVTATGTPISATLFFWPPKREPYDASNLEPRPGEVRALTIFGGSGAVRFWKHNGTAWASWQ